jgi:hypothetical protein
MARSRLTSSFFGVLTLGLLAAVAKFGRAVVLEILDWFISEETPLDTVVEEATTAAIKTRSRATGQSA